MVFPETLSVVFLVPALVVPTQFASVEVVEFFGHDARFFAATGRNAVDSRVHVFFVPNRLVFDCGQHSTGDL